MICPVTTSLDASPSQMIKQEVCFPRFVITRTHCSCLNASFPSSVSCKHFISNLRHPTLSTPAFPEGGINPLAHGLTQQTATFVQFGGISGCSVATRFCLVGLQEATSTSCSGWFVASSPRQRWQCSAWWQWLCDNSSLSRRAFYVVLTQQMPDGLCKPGLGFTSGNGDRAASPQLGSRPR